MMSTLKNGKIVRSLSGIPDKGPVLFVGYHALMGIELSPLYEEFLREKKKNCSWLGSSTFVWNKI